MDKIITITFSTTDTAREVENFLARLGILAASGMTKGHRPGVCARVPEAVVYNGGRCPLAGDYGVCSREE